ncbi:hypothetical protein L596_022205 [Steinernema carpocapsae]|uniref:UPAR/Ly6 domain-containing protein n=1 Tax=Steinernema carpocapsae TaxID=34508 RepID=A0A4U5ML44_STECR|nr:hypothetical protein L596_022205 [Steinernema carpocapsae]
MRLFLFLILPVVAWFLGLTGNGNLTNNQLDAILSCWTRMKLTPDLNDTITVMLENLGKPPLQSSGYNLENCDKDETECVTFYTANNADILAGCSKRLSFMYSALQGVCEELGTKCIDHLNFDDPQLNNASLGLCCCDCDYCNRGPGSVEKCSFVQTNCYVGANVDNKVKAYFRQGNISIHNGQKFTKNCTASRDKCLTLTIDETNVIAGCSSDFGSLYNVCDELENDCETVSNREHERSFSLAKLCCCSDDDCNDFKSSKRIRSVDAVILAAIFNVLV